MSNFFSNLWKLWNDKIKNLVFLTYFCYIFRCGFKTEGPSGERSINIKFSYYNLKQWQIHCSRPLSSSFRTFPLSFFISYFRERSTFSHCWELELSACTRLDISSNGLHNNTADWWCVSTDSIWIFCCLCHLCFRHCFICLFKYETMVWDWKSTICIEIPLTQKIFRTLNQTW